MLKILKVFPKITQTVILGNTDSLKPVYEKCEVFDKI